GGVNAQLWIVPSNTTGVPSENAILVGGGTTTGDDGSYLIKLTAATSPPYTISTYQFPYNFRPNANNGNSYITAVAQSALNTSHYYVGMADGTFFYSHDSGSNWLKANGFNAPANAFLYGTCILPSRIHPNRLFYSGSGYNNPGVYMSTNGGVSFTPLSTGLPATFVTELELNDTESLLFAATDAGPYVYVFSQGQWYSLNGVTTPLQDFKSVEYLPGINKVRFTTYGRGVWDLSLLSVPLPVEWVRFEAQKLPAGQVQLDWATGHEADNDYFDVQHSTDGVRFDPIGRVGSKGSGSQYTFRHTTPPPGVNYYRLKQVDTDGAYSFSDIRLVNMKPDLTPVVFPNPAPRESSFWVSQWTDEAAFTLYDQSGKTVHRAICTGPLEVPTTGLPAGVYYFHLQDRNSPEQFSGKIVIR
ncbi:MAG: T9SS type A sorting domain-containing protein, partial [Saprospiraceae bacterium]|nr:T9SS type A sorting domain-containing protein [Saprospiraceae bacterium]